MTDTSTQPKEQQPSPATVFADPAVSFWLKRSLQDALKRDPIDAANDAQLLASILAERADQLIQEGKSA